MIKKGPFSSIRELYIFERKQIKLKRQAFNGTKIVPIKHRNQKTLEEFK
jgi:hypothetical protein